MNVFDETYLDLVWDVKCGGTPKEDRTGVGTLSSFGHQSMYNLLNGFPLLQCKATHFKSIVVELLWFLRGDTNTAYLKQHGVSIWNEWEDENGDLGPIYGKQWRDFNGVDQISWLLNEIKTNPNSRRLIVSAWNPGDIPKMALAPCHSFFQINVDNAYMDMQLYQRSADVFLGVPFNIASYALLLTLIANHTGYKPRWFIHTIGDAHLYLNHLDQVKELDYRVRAKSIPNTYPQLNFNHKPTIFDYEPEDFSVLNYKPLPRISAPVAV